MSEQLALALNPPRARKRDPATSHAAAASAKGLQVAHQNKIMAALRSGPATIYELAARSGLDHVAVARRMPELLDLGQAHVTDETRPSPNGRSCRVWAAS